MYSDLGESLTLKHGPVSSVCDGKDMGWYFVSLDTLVALHDLLRVDGKPLVGVHHHAEETGVRLEQGKE